MPKETEKTREELVQEYKEKVEKRTNMVADNIERLKKRICNTRAYKDVLSEEDKEKILMHVQEKVEWLITSVRGETEQDTDFNL